MLGVRVREGITRWGPSPLGARDMGALPSLPVPNPVRMVLLLNPRAVEGMERLPLSFSSYEGVYV